MSDLIYYRASPSKFRQLYSVIGFLLIIISIVFFDNQYTPTFPNIYTLVPTCGTALIILYGQQTTFIGYVLSRSVLQWIGLVSYSAYLWHQPLFVFVRLESEHSVQLFTILVIIAIIFPLSLFSYSFIEQPFRNKKNFSQSTIFSMAGIAALLTLITGLCFIINSNHRISSLNNMSTINNMNNVNHMIHSIDTFDPIDTYLADLQKYGSSTYTAGYYDAHIIKENNCSTGPSPSNRRVALIGDSSSQDFFNMIIEGKYWTNYEVCLYKLVQECQIYLPSENKDDQSSRQGCGYVFDLKSELPIIRQANIIVLASRWKDWSAERLNTTIKLFNLTINQQVFVLGRKDFGAVNVNAYVDKPFEYRIKQYQYPDPDAVKANEALKKALDKSIYVDVQGMICTGVNQSCPIFTANGKLITFDGTHLTKHGALYVGRLIFNNEPLNRIK